MITWVPHILYDTEEIAIGGGNVSFFQRGSKPASLTNMASSGQLPHGRCMLVTGWAVMLDVDREAHLRDDGVASLTFFIGEACHWRMPLAGMRDNGHYRRPRWEFRLDHLLGPASIPVPPQETTFDEALQWTRKQAVIYPWILPPILNFRLVLDYTAGLFTGIATRHPTARVELHGLFTKEWA